MVIIVFLHRLTTVITTVIKDDEFYLAIVLPLRKSSLRKMIQERHNDREINLKVLQTLKPLVCGEHDRQHGDLKVINQRKKYSFDLF